MLAARQPYRRMGQATSRQIDHIVSPAPPSRVLWQGDELRRRQIAAGCTLEELEMILHPMVEDGQGGDRLDGRRHAARRAVARSIAACTTSSGRISARSPTRRSTACARRRVMSLKTRLGNLGNMLDAGREPDRAAAAGKPGAVHRPSSRRCGPSWATRRSRSTAPSLPPTARRALRAALDPHPRARPRRRCAHGCTHVVLTDEAIAAERARHPDDPRHRRGARPSGAAVAAHLHLAQRARRPNASTCIISPC